LLDLNVLQIDSPGVTNSQALVMAEQAEVCMAHNRHSPGVSCAVNDGRSSAIPIVWPISEDQERLQVGHADLQEATEGGAVGVAIAYMKHVHSLVVISRSPKDGNGFDYYMGPLGSGSILRSRPTAKLEVSGVLENGDVDCKARLKQKFEQVTRKISAEVQDFAVVVGFKAPSIWVKSK
jgi:hypothetical protein